MKRPTIVCSVLALAALDQAIKFIIAAHWAGKAIVIIPGVMEFRPTVNLDHSYLNQVLNLGMGFWRTMILSILSAVLFFTLYKLLRQRSVNVRLLDASLIFIFSAVSSALFSHILGNGVLDYICLRHLFTFDLKDAYVWTGIVLLYTAVLKDSKAGITLKKQDVKTLFRKVNK